MFGQNNFRENRREAFRFWQESGDALWRGWLTSPVYLEWNAFWMRSSLDFYENCLKLAAAGGFDAHLLHRTFRANLELLSFGTKCLRTNVRLAQNAGILPQTATTAARTVLQNEDFRLLRYESKNRKTAVPIVIVSSLVGKYYILDLTVERSYVAHLLEQGFDVFIVDWTTNEASAAKGLDDYVGDYLPQIVERVRHLSKSETVSLLGYSMGGLLALIYAAMHAAKVKNLLLLTTPVDFSQHNTIGDWTSAENFDVDRLIDLFGNVSGEAVSMSMQMVKPISSLSRAVNILQYADRKTDFDALLALEIWLHDSAPLPGELFRDVIKKLYRRNSLAKGTLKIKGEKVNLKKITASVLNVIGTYDQVAAPETSETLFDLLGDIDKTQLELDYGHLTIAVGSGAKDDFWRESAEWLKRVA